MPFSAVEKRLQRAPKEEEVAAELGICLEEYREWAGEINALTVGSLDSVTSQDDGRDLLQFVANDDQCFPQPQTERTVLTMYYRQELTLREISKSLQLHESRISQQKTQAVLRLRTFLAAKQPERGQAMAAAA